MSETIETHPAPGPLGRLAGVAVRNRGRVVLAWLAALFIAFGVSSTFGGEFSADYGAPGSDSSTAHALAAEAAGQSSGRPSVTLIAQAAGAVDGGRARAQVDQLVARVRDLPHVESVSDPWRSGTVSADGRTVLIDVGLDVESPEAMPVAATEQLVALAAATTTDDLTVAAGGDVVGLTEPEEVGSEVIGVAAAAVILLLTFGTVIAAGLPILMAVGGLAVSSFLTVVLASLLPVPDWSTSLVAMMGLGIGIDYALLMVTRFREWRGHGLSIERAAVATLDTAGRSVLLAGTTVVISMLGLFGMGLSFMRGAALATIVGVLVVLAAAMTLFPAMLGYFGGRIDRLRVPLPRRRTATTGAGWLRWSRFVQQHRYMATAVGVGVMVALAAPFAGVQFGSPDAGNNPEGSSTRTAYELTAAAFGPGANGRLLVVLDEPTTDATSRVAAALTATAGVAFVAPPITTPAGSVAVLSVVPTTGPQDPRTADLVRALRDDVLPAALTGTGATGHVGGATAASIDSEANVVRRIPLLLAGVVGLSLLLLLVAFRSVAIAVKAAVLNLMSVAASYGVVALVLQGGWFGQLFGIDGRTPLPAFVPVLMFAVLFSLSADYEIFLVSRMRDAYKRTGDTGAAIVAGLAGTARVITAAAAIMIAVFGAFVPSGDIAVKVIGIGMAAAILIDATIVRMLLVPAVMHVLGERNWWVPAWLDRRLPQVAVEGHEHHYLPAAVDVEARELAPAA